jgi:hypothetical protein
MGDKQSPEYAELTPLLLSALHDGFAQPLEGYLMERSGLPGARMNLPLVAAFADAMGDIVTQPDLPLERGEALVDGWAALSLADAPVNHPREILPSAAVQAYGQVAVSRPEWWEDEIAKLQRAANDPRWRVRESVAIALQRMLVANWSPTCERLVHWAQNETPLIARAAVAAVAEPPLLKDKAHAEDALSVQAEGVNSFMNIPPERRRDEDVRALRQALGYTLSVVTAASPETGFHLMEELAALPDPDVIWIVRENMKKKRLQPWQDRLQTLEIALFRPEDAADE